MMYVVFQLKSNITVFASQIDRETGNQHAHLSSGTELHTFKRIK